MKSKQYVTGQHQFKLLKSKLTISTLDCLGKNKSRYLFKVFELKTLKGENLVII